MHRYNQRLYIASVGLCDLPILENLIKPLIGLLGFALQRKRVISRSCLHRLHLGGKNKRGRNEGFYYFIHYVAADP